MGERGSLQCVGCLDWPPPPTTEYLFECTQMECGGLTLIRMTWFEFEYKVKIIEKYYHYRVQVTPFGKHNDQAKVASEIILHDLDLQRRLPSKGTCYDCGGTTVQIRECRGSSLLVSQTRYC